MEADSIIRIAAVIMGIVIMILSFGLLSIKKMTVGFAVIWEIVGIGLVVMGIVPMVPLWRMGFGKEEGFAVLGLGVVGVFVCYQFSVLVSGLSMKNQELAIEVSLLLREDEKDHREPEKELLVILPVYNEERNIQKVLEHLSQPEIQSIADILVINDGSSDSSGQMIESYQYMQITHVYGLGYGSALQLGYKYAVRKKYRYVIQMDADGQHDVCNIPLIYRRLSERDVDGSFPDIVLASRFMEGSTEFPVSAYKKFAFWLFRSMIRMASGRRIADPTTGLQGLSRRAFTYYSKYNNFDYRYPDANMVIQMLLLRFCVVEVPAVMHVRTDGKSMHSGLEPVWYMMCMFLNVLAVIFRIRVLKMDTETGTKDDH